MLWGGLRPIRSRLVLDTFALVVSGYAINAGRTQFLNNLPLEKLLLFLLAVAVTLATAGLTKRWTISFPLILIVVIQSLSQWYLLPEDSCTLSSSSSWPYVAQILGTFSRWASNGLLLFSAILTILFPAVEISHPNGKYNVGIIDLHLPVQFDEEKIKIHKFDMAIASETLSSSHYDTKKKKNDGYVSVKIFYPTIDQPESIPYFNQDISKRICEALMKVCSPPPMNKLTWMLHTWQLSKVKAKRNGTPMFHDKTKDQSDINQTPMGKLPVVVFSHGLTGNVSIYSYQAMNLAANGHLVFNIDHSDGSAIGMKKSDGSFLQYNPSIGALEKESAVTHVRARRRQTDHRASELLAVTDAILQLNTTNISELEKQGISFVNRLDLKNIAIGGHSFGGATAVTAASRNPTLFSCVVAHDPALDWMTDDARKIFFHESRFYGSNIEYSGGTGGYYELEEGGQEEKKDGDDKIHIPQTTSSKSIHDLDMFFLYSDEWKKRGWGGYPYVFDMFRRGQLGPSRNNRSECSFVHNANHSEFSDSCMKTPLWLARTIGLTGRRNPHETSEEIGARTLDFVNEILKKSNK